MPFKEGFDPNRNLAGKPVGTKSFTTKVREALEKIAEGKDYTYEEAFIKSIMKKAIVDGDPSTQKLVWNYLDGMPTIKAEVEGEMKHYVITVGDNKMDEIKNEEVGGIPVADEPVIETPNAENTGEPVQPASEPTVDTPVEPAV